MTASNESGKVLNGFFLVFLLHTLAFVMLPIVLAFIYQSNAQISSFIGGVLIRAFFSIGLTQFIYIAPALVILKQQRKWGLMKGAIIGAVVTALLNGGCWLLFLPSFR